MSFRNNYDARVISVLDFNYELPVHSVFHPVCKAAAKRRLIKMFPNYVKPLNQAFANRAAARVWGILIMDGGQPMCVVQNLACAVRDKSYRRVLRINVDAHYPGDPKPLDTSFLTRNIRLNEVCDPEISTMSAQ